MQWWTSEWNRTGDKIQKTCVNIVFYDGLQFNQTLHIMISLQFNQTLHIVISLQFNLTLYIVISLGFNQTLHIMISLPYNQTLHIMMSLQFNQTLLIMISLPFSILFYTLYLWRFVLCTSFWESASRLCGLSFFCLTSGIRISVFVHLHSEWMLED